MYVLFLKITTFLGLTLIIHPGHTSRFFETVKMKFMGPTGRGPRADEWGRGPRAEKNKYPSYDIKIHPLAINMNLFKEVQYNGSALRSAHLFIIAISSHSHIKRKQPQRIFLQYSCSVTMNNIVKNICEAKFMN